MTLVDLDSAAAGHRSGVDEQSREGPAAVPVAGSSTMPTVGLKKRA